MAQTGDKQFETLKNVPLMGIRTFLFKKLYSLDLSEAELKQVVADIKKEAPAHELPLLEAEERKIEQAVKTGSAPSDPDLSTPALQLLWSAHLLDLSEKLDVPIYQTALWKQLIHSPQARFELSQHAAYVAQDMVNPNTVIYWSEPRTLFAYNLGKNEIHIDLLASLILGLEDTRAIIFHEIGHSKLTRGRMDKMVETDKEVESLYVKHQAGTLTPAEEERLLELHTQRKFMHRIWDEAENNPVDRYAINRSHTMAQDFGRSMNNVETVFLQWQPHTPSDPPTAADKFMNLTKAIRMAVYQHNDFFNDTKEGWEQVGVHPDWFTALPAKPGDPAPTPEEAFRHLVDLCSGPEGLENLQPAQKDRMRGAEWLERVTDEYSRRRLAIADEIWTRYAEPLVKELMPEAKERSRQELNRGNAAEPPPPPPPDGGEQTPEGAPPRPPQTAPQQPRPAESQPVPEGAPPRLPETAPALQPQAPTPAEKPQDAQTLEALLAALEEQKNREQVPVAPVPAFLEAPDVPEMVRTDLSGGISYVPPTPMIGDWSQYQTCVAQFAREILDIKRLLVNIQKRQTYLTHKPSARHSLLPEDGDVSRFDTGAHRRFTTKILTGQEVTEHDAKRFIEDEPQKKPAPIDIVLLIDGSFSMYSKHDKHGNSWPFAPIQIGIQTACMLNEAAKNLNINVYMGLWGNDPPLMLVKPGDDPKKIGEAIAGVANSQGWGTSLAPAISHTVKDLAKTRIAPATPVGQTHFIVISDGDIFDEAAAKLTMERLFNNCKHVTCDVAVIQKGNTDMDKVVREMQEKYTPAKVGLKHCDTPAVAQHGILDMLHDRMRMTGYSQAIPAIQKSKAFNRAHRQM